MALWTRFKRLIRSIFGGAISSLENPRLILEQNIRELNEQVPKMNENIATVKANVILLQKEERRARSEVEMLTSKIKAALQGGREDLAQQQALRLEAARNQFDKSKEQLAYASAAYDKAQQVKKVFMRERQRKIDEAQEALRAHERAKWQSEIADALEQFEVAGIDNTHGEMISRLDQETARNEARMEMALDSVDADALRLDEDSESFRAAEIVRQMKIEMGLEKEAEKPTLTRLNLDEPESGDRTIGRSQVN